MVRVTLPIFSGVSTTPIILVRGLAWASASRACGVEIISLMAARFSSRERVQLLLVTFSMQPTRRSA